MNSRPFSSPSAALAAGCLVFLALAGCDDGGEDFDISQQIGPDPVLPDPARRS